MQSIVASVYGDRSHYDSKVKGDHSRRGVTSMVKAGRYVGSRRPYGLHRSPSETGTQASTYGVLGLED